MLQDTGEILTAAYFLLYILWGLGPLPAPRWSASVIQLNISRAICRIVSQALMSLGQYGCLCAGKVSTRARGRTKTIMWSKFASRRTWHTREKFEQCWFWEILIRNSWRSFWRTETENPTQNRVIIPHYCNQSKQQDKSFNSGTQYIRVIYISWITTTLFLRAYVRYLKGSRGTAKLRTGWASWA